MSVAEEAKELRLRADLRALMEVQFLVERFHCEYAATLDRGQIERWPEFFTQDAVYRVTARENVETGEPLDLMSCDSPGMFLDRAYAIANTEMFGPRYVKHYITNVRILNCNLPLVEAEANYLIVETVTDEPTRILQAGTYRDVFELREDACLIRSRQCVYDTVVVPNCMIYPA